MPGHSVKPADQEHGVTTLFRERFAGLVALAHLLGADDPESVVQEAFLRLYGHWSSLRSTEAAEGYLRSIVVNLTRSRQRHLAVEQRHISSAAPADVAVHDQVIVLADRAEVISALNSLSVRHREAIVLRYWLDLSQAQMAQTMGISVGSVKSHVSRGLAALRSALASTEGKTGDRGRSGQASQRPESRS